MLDVKYGAQTDIGKYREKNEDGYLTTERLFAVADGMGGHLGGEVASRLALETLARDFSQIRLPRTRGRMTSLFKKSVNRANRIIYEKSFAEPGLRGMGTTLTALVMTENKAKENLAYLAHVGDSRAYLLREGKLAQLTEDHSLVAQMVKEGKLSSEEAETHPLKSILTRALGTEDLAVVDVIPFPLQSKDKIILCTDGLSNMLKDEEIKIFLEKNLTPQEICKRLVKAANDRGGIDNITVVLIEIS